jgi:DNA (cytosine-5)-methyltransferase 3A
MSGCQIALKELGVKVDNYYASEVDKHAIQVTMHNFPNTIQLGDVTKINTSTLPEIQLLAGGSPCQSFSFAGKRKGMSTTCSTEILTLDHYLQLKEEGFEFEGQSYLFWEYMRILKEVKPKYFLLENVEMGEKWEKILSKAIGMNGIHINSALVSAQNRKRIYWTNIGAKPSGLFGDLQCSIPQPKDQGILLKDILEQNVDEKYYLSNKTIDALIGSIGPIKENNQEFNAVDCDGYQDKQKSGTLMSRYHKGISSFGSNTFIVDNANAILTPKRTEYGKQIRKDYEAGKIKEPRKNVQQLEPRTDGKTNTITSVQKDNLVLQLNPSKESQGVQPYQQNRVYDTNGISPCLSVDARSPAIHENPRIRRLTTTECKKLQTVPDWYDMSVVSETQQYRQLGNGWTIEVIKHILSFM